MDRIRISRPTYTLALAGEKTPLEYLLLWMDRLSFGLIVYSLLWANALAFSAMMSSGQPGWLSPVVPLLVAGIGGYSCSLVVRLCRELALWFEHGD